MPTIPQPTVLAWPNQSLSKPKMWLNSPSWLKMKRTIVVIATDEAIEGK